MSFRAHERTKKEIARMFRQRPLALLTLNLLMGIVPSAQSDSFTFTRINFPGAVATEVDGINARGQMVGTYYTLVFPDFYKQSHGFLLDRGTFTTIDVPGSEGSSAFAINGRGQIVGVAGTQGFLLDRGTFDTIAVPGARLSIPLGINDFGQIVGLYEDVSRHGFLLDQGTFIPIDFPGAVATFANAINGRQQIVGGYTDASGIVHGFLLDQGTFTTIDRPGAVVNARGINDRGQIVGGSAVGAQATGFLLDRGRFTTIEVPSGDNEFVILTTVNGSTMVGRWLVAITTLSARRTMVSRRDGSDGAPRNSQSRVPSASRRTA
jgi:uncharacterized membrane protein